LIVVEITNALCFQNRFLFFPLKVPPSPEDRLVGNESTKEHLKKRLAETFIKCGLAENAVRNSLVDIEKKGNYWRLRTHIFGMVLFSAPSYLTELE